MRKILIALTALASIAFVGSASAERIVIRHGHHHGWHHGWHHHHHWDRGLHRGWRNHHRTVVIKHRY